MIRAYTRGAALAPVMHTQTSRRVVRLLDGAGQTLAEITADHVSAESADGSASWDEIEAELVAGGPALLTVIDTQLRRVGARPAATGTKLRRALAGRLPPPKPYPRTSPPPTTPPNKLHTLHDSVVARTVLLDLAGKARAAGEDTFTYGLMYQRQACQAANIEQALPRFAGRDVIEPWAVDRDEEG